jgi:hypothetical protein
LIRSPKSARQSPLVDSNFITHADEQAQATIRTFKAQTPQQGADTLIWLATAEEPGDSSGGHGVV